MLRKKYFLELQLKLFEFRKEKTQKNISDTKNIK